METRKTETESEHFDQVQSMQVIREMIDISRRKLQNDGILFMVWGWALFIRP